MIHSYKQGKVDIVQEKLTFCNYLSVAQGNSLSDGRLTCEIVNNIQWPMWAYREFC